jgi:NhaP-type Na+/H+ or K+/H+ antiporter
VFVLPDQVPADLKLEPVVLFSEMAMAIMLFTDASRIKIRTLVASPGLPARLLAFGMHLTLLLGTLIALVLLADLKLWEAAIVATILAPTDAGLGQVVVHSLRVPIRIRQALNAEAGLNDGISLSFLMLFIAQARVNQPLPQPSWIDYAVR